MRNYEAARNPQWQARRAEASTYTIFHNLLEYVSNLRAHYDAYRMQFWKWIVSDWTVLRVQQDFKKSIDVTLVRYEGLV